MEEQSKNARLAQEIQQINPVEKIRRPTDRLVVYVYSLFMLLWLVIGIAALCAHPRGKDEETIWKLCIYAPFPRLSFIHSIVFVTSLTLSTGFILLSIFLNKKFTMFFIYLGMVIYVISIISIISASLKSILGSTKDVYGYSNIIYNNQHDPSINLFLECLHVISATWIIFKAIFMIPSVISFFNVDKNEIRNVIEDFCRVILSSPDMILFVGFITILGCFIFSFTMHAVITDTESNRDIIHILFDFFFLLLGGIFALSFIYNFALMVISLYTVNYYWKEGDKPAVGQSVSQIMKNHIGTIMFSSTPFVPFICAIVQAVKHTRSPKNKENFLFYIASKIFLVLSIENFALIVSSIYSTGFIKSSKNTLDIVLRRCIFYLAASGVIEAVISITAIIVLVLAGIAFRITLVVFVPSDQEANRRDSLSKLDIDKLMYMASFLYGFFIPFVTFTLLIYSSVKALLLNKIVILNKGEQYNGEKTEVTSLNDH